MSLRFKRYYRLPVLLGIVAVVAVLGFGDLRIVAYTSAGAEATAEATAASGSTYDNEVGLFDDTAIHSIQIVISDDDYEQMITTYQETGEKDYFQADVIIDGVLVSDVGLRLKGNASLRTALGGGGGMAGAGQRPAGGGPAQFDPANMPDPGERPAMPDGERPAPGQMPQGGEPFGDAAAELGGDASMLPLMIKFDEFVSGQTYQGYSLLAIRTYGTSTDAAMLQEPVTNAIFRAAGLPAPQTAYAGVQINDEAERLFTLSEVIDDTYVEKYFPGTDGVLYKAEVGATLTYLGEDPSLYADTFTQQARVNDADLAPLIDFMRFLAEADDETFASELPAYLDVDAFAAYLAINNLLVNTDSIVGMNNNYYLYYDDVEERFTLLMWDGNESLGKLARGGQVATYDLYYESEGGGGFGMRGMGGANVLATRFLADPTFSALYEAKLQEIYEVAFLDGTIAQVVEGYAGLVREANEARSLAALEDYEAAVGNVLDFVAQRGAYLAATPLLGGQAAQAGQ